MSNQIIKHMWTDEELWDGSHSIFHLLFFLFLQIYNLSIYHLLLPSCALASYHSLLTKVHSDSVAVLSRSLRFSDSVAVLSRILQLPYTRTCGKLAQTTTKKVSASGTVVLAAGYWLAARAVPCQYVRKRINSMYNSLGLGKKV